MPTPPKDAYRAFLGTVLSHLFLGIYTTVFALYMHLKRARRSQFVAVDYGVIALFSCTVLTIALDTIQQFWTVCRGSQSAPWLAKIDATTSSLSITLNFASQIILIYRCWNIWDRVICVIVPPGCLAVVSWVCGIAVTIDLYTVADASQRVAKDWWMPLGVTSMGLSLGVNALVSGLMSPGVAVSVLLESAVALFIAQLVYMVLYQLGHPAFALVAGPVTIIYGLNCTAIMVLVAMNRSFDVVGTDIGRTQHSVMVFAPRTVTSEYLEVSSLTVRGEANWGGARITSIDEHKV
ncbi:hypothetical protein FA13DRAFT_1791478 [Coprinellus micaceus]|uniref:Uncharacterized protein n=1 Tax=Coprinellus micaceus TaxID=71717 RepID=A0A4Y7TC33_COPMI|nr:hypothetical protein FA13DRAFT_1791478 [Coprinellus micaceus]